LRNIIAGKSFFFEIWEFGMARITLQGQSKVTPLSKKKGNYEYKHKKLSPTAFVFQIEPE